MVAHLHDTYYDAKATLISEADIKKIRESRGKIPNASKKMADKFHIGSKCVYEIWDNKERIQQELFHFPLPKYITLHKTGKKDMQ
ncbi:11677_t:CDS:2 [Funneliformis geosporum]|uniref:11677_t:CDS:1 n=1 Tax=Funneliformis geosporum TaxID=1117311 RepID=A0A9W4T3R2_9GLOM|nr:11677_t:CDS:2 [Funneliformis geosporum]